VTTLDEIARQVTVCRACNLCRTRNRAVPGEGPADARILFIGEAPGWNENQQGRPFVGAAGQLLNELLQSIGLRREEVFITNVVKCQPPGNRDPQPDEIAACSAYLDAQVALLQPRLVVTLGRFSMARWFPNARISAIHGQAKKIGGTVYLPMYHPAAALHQPSLRSAIEADMVTIPRLLADIEQLEEADHAPPPPQQLSLF
jgi:DNA polymerase